MLAYILFEILISDSSIIQRCVVRASKYRVVISITLEPLHTCTLYILILSTDVIANIDQYVQLPGIARGCNINFA